SPLGGSQFLALADGQLSRTLNVVPGNRYAFSYSFRGPGAVSWWRGDSLPTAVDVVSGNNGTFNGFVAFPPAVVGQGFQFNGTSDITVPDNPTLSFTRALTLEMWYEDQGSPATHYGLMAKRGLAGGINYGINHRYDLQHIQGYFFNPITGPTAQVA